MLNLKKDAGNRARKDDNDEEDEDISAAAV